jgi:hypothetical protein
MPKTDKEILAFNFSDQVPSVLVFLQQAGVYDKYFLFACVEVLMMETNHSLVLDSKKQRLQVFDAAKLAK